MKRLHFLLILIWPLIGMGQDLKHVYETLSTLKPMSAEEVFSGAHPGVASDLGFIRQVGVLDNQMLFYSSKIHSIVQEKVDQALIHLFRRSDQMKTLCTVIGSHPLSHKNLLGLSDKASIITSDLCATYLGYRDQKERRYKLPKSYMFVFNIPTNHPVQSWTNFSNETYIFFDHSLSEAELAARLLHEVAIMTDAKQGMSEKTFDLLVNSYGFSVTAKNGDLQKSKMQLIQLHSIPTVRLAFSIVRATIIEEIILKEVYGEDVFHQLSNQELLKLVEQANYRGAVELVLRETLPFQRLSLSVEHIKLYEKLGPKYFEPFFISEAQIPEILNSFERMDLVFKENGLFKTGLNSRQWLSLAMVGGESMFYTRGPRPRVGGGWGDQVQKENIPNLKRTDILDLHRKSNDLKFPKIKNSESQTPAFEFRNKENDEVKK